MTSLPALALKSPNSPFQIIFIIFSIKGQYVTLDMEGEIHMKIWFKNKNKLK
jgi:hypothetical protein